PGCRRSSFRNHHFKYTIKMIIFKPPLRAIVCFNIALLGYSCNQEQSKPDTNTGLSTEFTERVYKEVNLGEIQPEGWLNDLLETMNTNSTGHLDEIYD